MAYGDGSRQYDAAVGDRHIGSGKHAGRESRDMERLNTDELRVPVAALRPRLVQ
jgi:hypothetical protein